MNQIVINGDNIELLKKYTDNYFDAVVTDPPYGLGKEPNAAELMKDWVEHGYHEISGKGFMGKEWDAFVPQPIFWKEVFRVLKPGGHVLSFYGTRTYDWGVMSMRFAGFEVRDCIQWLYGSGFPKSHNISKALDKMEGAKREVIGEQVIPYKDKNRSVLQPKDGWNNNSMKTKFDITAPSTDAAKQWDGWGTALKPANEPIVLARKPLEKGLSIAENILKWGVGGINIDASRIGVSQDDPNHRPNWENHTTEKKGDVYGVYEKRKAETLTQGRFPANIILTHHEDCVCKGTKKVKGDGNFPKTQNTESWKMASKGKSLTPEKDYADANGKEIVENWECHEDCPIRILDEQSGVLKSGKAEIGTGREGNFTNGIYGAKASKIASCYADKGGASRFFYVAKASKSERNKGLDEFEEKAKVFNGKTKSSTIEGYEDGSVEDKFTTQPNKNFHPTVKPIKLMQYLVKMITPPNGIVLDPFCGSGTTGVACKIDGFQFVGLEQDQDYSKIAQARINNFIENNQENKLVTINIEEPTINKLDEEQLKLF